MVAMYYTKPENGNKLGTAPSSCTKLSQTLGLAEGEPRLDALNWHEEPPDI
jgi:hypothetical protein